jgi:hypothetical protein
MNVTLSVDKYIHTCRVTVFFGGTCYYLPGYESVGPHECLVIIPNYYFDFWIEGTSCKYCFYLWFILETKCR